MKVASMPKPRKPRVEKKVSKKTANVSFCFCLDEAPPDQCFWVNYGPVVKDLAELREAFMQMTDDQFRFHAMDRGVNDFSKWISEVLGHGECAKKIARAKTREAAYRALATCSDK